MKTCCGLYPVCYCRELPPDDEHRARTRQRPVRRPVPVPPDEILRQAERDGRRDARLQRAAWLTAIGLVLGLAAIVLTLAGCRPLDGPRVPEPTGTEMYTVHAGGIYDNN